MVISEMPSNIWSLECTFNLSIDRSGTTVMEYLENRGVKWIFGFHDQSDLCLYKENVGGLSLCRFKEEYTRRLFRKPFIRLIGEPRELASAAYFFARRENTLSVAPGEEYKRIYFASEWLDPMLDDWHKRNDAICWIARPTKERINLAQKLIHEKIPLHIYSREPWPMPEWKGYAGNEIEVSHLYRYRIVSENSCTFGYHSEKLFNSIRSGCISIYRGDSKLDLSHLEGSFLPFNMEVIRHRSDFADNILEGIENVMFSSRWEVHSFRNFYETILQLASQFCESKDL